MPTDVTAALAELSQKLAILEPQLEGLRDYARLNLDDETKNIVALEITRYERRRALLNAGLDALDDLIADGHPVMDPVEIPQRAYSDLQANAATIEAALAQFAPNTAAGLNLAAGGSEPKA